MKSLHKELTDIIIKVALGHHDDISKADEDNACEAADAIIAKIEERGECPGCGADLSYQRHWVRCSERTALKNTLTGEKR